jgi:hypothetical protein
VEILERTRQHLAQAREGADVGDELVADLDAIDALPYPNGNEEWRARYDVTRVAWLVLLASPHRSHVERAVSTATAYLTEAGTDAPRPRGLLLRDGDPLGVPLPDNPWGVPPQASLDEAVTQVWGPIADRCPRFVATLRDRLVGLTLADDHRGRPHLVYLLRHDFDGYLLAPEHREARSHRSTAATRWPGNTSATSAR